MTTPLNINADPILVELYDLSKKIKIRFNYSGSVAGWIYTGISVDDQGQITQLMTKEKSLIYRKN